MVKLKGGVSEISNTLKRLRTTYLVGDCDPGAETMKALENLENLRPPKWKTLGFWSKIAGILALFFAVMVFLVGCDYSRDYTRSCNEVGKWGHGFWQKTCTTRWADGTERTVTQIKECDGPGFNTNCYDSKETR